MAENADTVGDLVFEALVRIFLSPLLPLSSLSPQLKIYSLSSFTPHTPTSHPPSHLTLPPHTLPLTLSSHTLLTPSHLPPSHRCSSSVCWLLRSTRTFVQFWTLTVTNSSMLPLCTRKEWREWKEGGREGGNAATTMKAGERVRRKREGGKASDWLCSQLY